MSRSITEQYGSQRSTETAYLLSSSKLVKLTPKVKENRRPSSMFAGVERFFRDVFLPQGYPESVTEDYVPYQIWDTVQAFASSLTGALASEAVLRGAGVGDASASALATALTWLLKDGAGMVGRIGFAWANGSALDADCKKWRLAADVLNDGAFLLDLLAPLARGHFTLIVCVSSVMRSLVGVAGGATRAALTQHQARRNNLADVSAKDGSQETLVNLFALVCSFFLLQAVSGNMLLVWSLFCGFTMLHLFANYRAVSCLCLQTLNGARLRILVRAFLGRREKVLSLKAANAEEPIVGALFGLASAPTVRYGVSVSELGDGPTIDAALQRAHKAKRRYMLAKRGGKILVSLEEGSEVSDLIEAGLAAEFLGAHEAKPKTVEEACAWAQERHWELVAGLEREGWETTFTLLNPDEWRYRMD